MKFMGSKRRLAKEILPLMLERKKPEQYWVEPFVGGGNMIEHVPGKRLGADADHNVISALIAIRDHVYDLPKNNTEFTEKDYRILKLSDDTWLKSYVGFALSYGGKWFGGWRRDKVGRRDYVAESYRNALRQSPLLKTVKFVHSSYDNLEVPEQSFIYCDPPYHGTTAYNRCAFDSEKFWQWCREKVAEGHTIFISEYRAPEDFICIWEKQQVSSLTKNTGAKVGIEKLFTIGG